jgi:hypothetical protein
MMRHNTMYFKKLFDYSVPLVAASTILVIGAVIVSLYAGKVMSDIKLANDTIEVTGSAKEAVVADMGRWTITLDAHTGANDQQAGFERLDAAIAKITGHLTEIGFAEYETPTGTTYPTYTYPQYGEPILTGYTVSRSITVRSTDIEKLSALANNVEPFVGQGYNVATGMLELTYSKLPEIRVKLLSEAIQDATDRAKAIAQDSGRAVGTLRNASSGVVQVLPLGGVDISDYGSYDTQSINKEVMVTVRATFGLN